MREATCGACGRVVRQSSKGGIRVLGGRELGAVVIERGICELEKNPSFPNFWAVSRNFFGFHTAPVGGTIGVLRGIDHSLCPKRLSLL